MKTGFFILLLTISLIASANACTNTLDDYAVEVILNNKNITYDLNRLFLMQNINYYKQESIMQSQYSNELASIVKESNESCTKCLLIKIQIPVETMTKEIESFSFVSSIGIKEIKPVEDKSYYNNWFITKKENDIYLKKEGIKIIISQFEKRNNILVEIDKKLGNCTDCSGKCIVSSHTNSYGDLCINNELKTEIDSVLKFLINSNFNELFLNYMVIWNGKKEITDLSPKKEYFDLKEALKQELVFLKRNEIINLTDNEIENIAKLADKGKAGNSKIVYHGNVWDYYYNIFGFSKEKNCNSFPASSIPNEKPAFSNKKSYYFVPLVIFSIVLLIMLILLLTARILNKFMARKKK